MSLTKSLEKVITDTIKQYIEVIASKYGLDSNKLLADWHTNQGVEVNQGVQGNIKEVTETGKFDKLDAVYILKCKKPELKALCKQRGLPCTGTKAVLIGHLQGKAPVAKAKRKAKTKVTAKKLEPKSLSKLKAQIPVIAIRKNQFGHHEHPETGFIFDTKLKKVIGTQQEDGNVKELTKEDINICNKFKFSYVLPTNLDSGATLEDEVVEELDDVLIEEEELSEEEEVVEEEELSEDEMVEEDEIIEEEELSEEELSEEEEEY